MNPRLLVDLNILRVSLVKHPAVPKAEFVVVKSCNDREGQEPIEKTAEFITKDDAKREVYAYALVPGEVDLQGDILSPADIEGACHSFMKNLATGDPRSMATQGTDIEHQFGTDSSGQPVGYPIVSMFDADGVCAADKSIRGGWWVGLKVTSDEVWQKIQQGELTGFSIGGRGTRVDCEAFAADETQKATGETVSKYAHTSKTKEPEPKWSDVDKTKLPPEAFALVPDQEHRSSWKYPHHWLSGGVMYLHRGGLRAALQRASQNNLQGKALAHLRAHREAIGMGKSAEEDDSMAEKAETKVDEEVVETLLDRIKRLLVGVDKSETTEESATDNAQTQEAEGASESDGNEGDTEGQAETEKPDEKPEVDAEKADNELAQQLSALSTELSTIASELADGIGKIQESLALAKTERDAAAASLKKSEGVLAETQKAIESLEKRVKFLEDTEPLSVGNNGDKETGHVEAQKAQHIPRLIPGIDVSTQLRMARRG